MKFIVVLAFVVLSEVCASNNQQQSSFQPVVIEDNNNKPQLTRAIKLKEEEKKQDPIKDENKECNSAVEAATTMPEVSIWVQALTAANLTNFFSNPELNKATFLIPTNDAFLSFFDYLGIDDKDSALADPQLKNILIYHILPINTTKVLLDNNSIILNTALSNKNLRMVIENEVIMYFGLGSRANVVGQVEICGGAVIQIIDEVLMSDISELALGCSDQSANALKNQTNVSLWVCDHS